MTRYAILSDIHANLEALKAVLDFSRGLNIDKKYSLGDVVGYGPNPNECLEMVKDFDGLVIGNHSILVLDENARFFGVLSDLITDNISWTRQELTKDNLELLRTFKDTIRIDDFVLSHGSPINPREMRYVRDWPYKGPESNVEPEFNYLVNEEARLLFYGHSHEQVMHLFYGNDEVRKELIKTRGKIELNRIRPEYGESILFSRGLINVGAVGQPRDRNPRACFVVYDDKEQTIEYHRVGYLVKVASQKIIEAKLEPFFAERLLIGE
jgi:predicted phosphodiesterase